MKELDILKKICLFFIWLFLLYQENFSDFTIEQSAIRADGRFKKDGGKEDV